MGGWGGGAGIFLSLYTQEKMPQKGIENNIIIITLLCTKFCKMYYADFF